MKERKTGKAALVIAVVLVALMICAAMLYPKLTATLDQVNSGTLETTTPQMIQAPDVTPDATDILATTDAPETQSEEETTMPEVTVVPQAQATQQPTEEPAEVAGPMPRQNLAATFTVYTDDGTSVRLSDLRGKPTVVNFFASWCGPCKIEMPYFEAAYQAYGDQINFMMVNLCGLGNDSKDNAKAMVEEGGYTFPVYFDVDGDAAIRYAIRSMPTTIFVSAEGELMGKTIGSMTNDQLLAEIDKLMK